MPDVREVTCPKCGAPLEITVNEPPEPEPDALETLTARLDALETENKELRDALDTREEPEEEDPDEA